uniref:PGG domain-containing protein n=1 Tax=Daucus carota subsp. sativus TaxID=79200 RepID=A0A162AM43_DAUCS
MAETSTKSSTADVEAEMSHQHSIEIVAASPPPPPPRLLPPPAPPLPPRTRNHRNLWGIIGDRSLSNPDSSEKRSHHSIKMPKTPPQAPPLPPKSGPRKPSIIYLSEDQRENYIDICVPVYNAAIKGDWHAAEKIIRGCPEVINTSITKRQDTVLHIISSTKHTHFAEKLVNLMKPEDLELQNGLGETALCLAVASNVKMVRILLKKNNGLLRIRKNGDLPFMLAVRYGDKHMVEYIYSETNMDDEKWNYLDQKRILESCLSLGLFDIALKIFKHCKDDHKIETDILGFLANSPSAFDGTLGPALRRLLHPSKFSTGNCVIYHGPSVQEVKSRVSPTDRRQVNNDNKTPQELFTEQHADLMEKGEKWMKETAAQCMIVAALIATIMFAAAFTLPGGNNSEDGHPIFLKRSAFIVFAVTDAISLCTSSASILVFLAILTARYTENDFLASLPLKLMVGLVTLFISIATMMVAYGASFFLLYPRSMKWIPILVTVLAGLPVISFAGLQFGLLFDVINSTFNSRHLFRPKKHMLY